jgi:protocatechuate 3,4-dioxygenase beta subunit
MTHPNNDHHHDGGLQQDLDAINRHMHERRQLLSWMAIGGGTAWLTACGVGRVGRKASGSASNSQAASCMANPMETNGPFPADGFNGVDDRIINILSTRGIVRSDIRSSFGASTTTAQGVPLTLKIKLVNANAQCMALADHAIYVWHCNRDGDYSLYAESIQTENYLRGMQVTDANGEVSFSSIFPACYAGRWPHIHIEVYRSLSAATGYDKALLVSQFALPRSTCETVYTKAAGYASSEAELARTRLADDLVFADATAAQLAQMTPVITGDVTTGYTATVLVGLAL